jgi:uncharacterized repeat protein (TIGR03803 family)
VNRARSIRNNPIFLKVILAAAAMLTAGSFATAQTETTLHSFNIKTPSVGGTNPEAALIMDSAGNLYGTTYGGGTGGGNDLECSTLSGCGTVFELKHTSNGWKEVVLHNFGNGHDGFNPLASLVFDSAGNLYGTTEFGGTATCGCGTAFELMPQASGTWVEKLLYSFRDNHSAAYPFSSLVFDADGDIYGTTTGGAFGYGTAYQLKPGSSGSWTEKVLHSFSQANDDATEPSGALIADSHGNLYGTTVSGGSAANAGTVFQFTPEPGGRFAYKILWAFEGFPEAAGPFAGLVADVAGNLYGTTYQGGIFNDGTVFELSPTASGKWTEKILHSFDGSDGTNPLYYPLVIDAAGNLYGTTYLGGTNDMGVAFKLTLGSGGGWTESVLHNFGSGPQDGQMPYGGLILGSSGTLYGTTFQGGAEGGGTVFQITP